MKTAIQQHARELGFDACRFTTAAPPTNAPRFRQWLAAQHHGEMAYLQRNAHKRVDPQQVLANAKSIITLAVSYAEGGRGSRVEGRAPDVAHSAGVSQPFHPPVACGGRATLPPPQTPHSASISQPSTLPPSSSLRRTGNSHLPGLIARYARYTDYHDVIGERLKQLTAFVSQIGGEGTRSLWYVDTGPFLERDLAERAGLGFIGKHTNLISRRLGNWIFLSEIITTLELEPDAPEKNRCGNCARCITACPTQAITAPFQLDARRCISYLTIELKGSIPVEFRAAIGNRIYGCDDCLAVCPWNRFAQEGKLMKPHARPDLTAPDLLELLALDDDGFKRRFAGTPMMRTKRRGFLRNVCVALGNVGDATALPALTRATSDAEPLIAEHARWAIEQIHERVKTVSRIN